MQKEKGKTKDQKKEKKTIKKAKEKKKNPMPKGEFLFNVLSLVIVIGIGIYFGGRSLYYYSEQNNATKEEAGTLVEKILENNKITKDASGFHQTDDGYLFVGNVENNYVLYSNRLFRILKVNEDHTIKLVSQENQNILTLGDGETYEGSNLQLWLTKKEQIEQSGIFYQSLSDAYNNLVETEYCEGILKDNKVKCSGKNKKDYVTLLSMEDYLNASSKDGFLNNGQFSWLLGKQNDAFLYKDEKGMIGEAETQEGYGVRPVITLDKRMKYISGDGTAANPYQIEEGTKTKVGSFVQLGEDVYQVYKEDDQFLYLSLDGYLTLNGKELVKSYDQLTTQFDVNTRTNIAYYLNNTHYFKLTYKDYLQDFPVYTGEISDEEGLSYLNQYKASVPVKMGLLSIADLKMNQNLTDYYLSNTTSSVGDSGYIYDGTGILKEGDVAVEKHLVPTVAILKTSIKQGDGSKTNPLKVE